MSVETSQIACRDDTRCAGVCVSITCIGTGDQTVQVFCFETLI